MNQDEILRRVKETNTAELDTELVAEIYSHVLFLLSDSIAASDLQRLILLGAAMYKNGTSARAELQMPPLVSDIGVPPTSYLQ
ncbi:MAG TPA: hypothetical protein VIM12_05950 [Noviherbaspirillum sp.]|uniref:hypothetical protein n=1 Tax=Noviherbaspirillum sp. TaxID=1926288 RepID=UPI002F9336E7